MNTMTTVSEVLNTLKERGYTVDFNLNDNCLVCHNNAIQIYPDEFIVDKHYRFEGQSDPGDEAVVYAISSTKHNIKGTLVNGYGIYSEPIADDMIKALKEYTAASPQPDKKLGAEVKSNQATPLRPAGNRVLDAPMVLMDLNTYMRQIKEERAWQTGDRNAITLFKTNGMRIVMVGLHKDAELKTHTAEGIISVQVLEGKISFTTMKQSSSFSKGQMLSLHKGIPHSVYADEESIFLLTLTTTLENK